MDNTIVNIGPSDEPDSANNRILVINAGSAKKEKVFISAKEMGLSIVLVHPGSTYAKRYVDEHIDTTNKSDTEILKILENIHAFNPFAGVVTFLEEDVEFTARVAQKLNLIGTDPKVALMARDKYLMRQKLQIGNVPVPQAFLASSWSEVTSAAQKTGYPLVIKPFKGTDSMWVFKVTSESQLKTTFDNLEKFARHPYEGVVLVETNKYVVEEYMPGPEVSVEVLVQNGVITIVGILDKHPMKEPYFIERGDVSPSRHPAAVQADIRNVATKTVQTMGITNSVVHIEIKVTPEGAKVVEIASRMGGEYICEWMEKIHGVNLARQGLRICLGLPIDQFPTPPQIYLRGEYFIPEKNSIFERIEGLDIIQDDPHLVMFSLWAKPGDTILTPPHGFETTGCMVVSGTSPENVDMETTRMLNQVNVIYSSDTVETHTQKSLVHVGLRQHE